MFGFATDQIQQVPLVKGNGVSFESQHQLFMRVPEFVSYETWLLGGRKIRVKNEAPI